jgi:hypothetical protein
VKDRLLAGQGNPGFGSSLGNRLRWTSSDDLGNYSGILKVRFLAMQTAQRKVEGFGRRRFLIYRWLKGLLICRRNEDEDEFADDWRRLTERG